MNRRHFLGAGLGAALSCGAALRGRKEEVRIGLVESMFRDIPEKSVKASIDQFREIMEKETGHTGESVTIKDYTGVADQVMKNQVQLGALHGFEFAWVRKKYPDLRPLAVAVNQQRYVNSHLLALAKEPVADLSGLKGQTLAIPEQTKAYNLLFLERQCRKAGADIEKYFGKTVKPKNVEIGLDDLVDGLVGVALVDSVGLERFRARKPARAARLKEVLKSPPFPPTAVVFQQGKLEEETLASFRKALVELNRGATGQEILTTWKLTGFEPVPNDYDRRLDEIAAEFPPVEH